MDGVNALLAISHDVLPELREQRDHYYRFWYAVGAVAITGWVLVYVLLRARPITVRLLARLAAGSAVVGSGLGWVTWWGLSAWSWGDYGVGSRWVGELTACILGMVGWCLAIGWFILTRDKSFPSNHQKARVACAPPEHDTAT